MSEWIEWNGGECPVPGDTRVDIMTRNGDVSSGGLTAKSWFWNHDGDSSDIIAYRIVQQTNIPPTNAADAARHATTDKLQPQFVAPTDAPKTLRDEVAIAILTGLHAYYGVDEGSIAYALGRADAYMEARKQ